MVLAQLFLQAGAGQLQADGRTTRAAAVSSRSWLCSGSEQRQNGKLGQIMAV
jgi:hypothetical protein